MCLTSDSIFPASRFSLSIPAVIPLLNRLIPAFDDAVAPAMFELLCGVAQRDDRDCLVTAASGDLAM